MAWTCLAWGLLLVCYFLMPAPPAPADNPNLPVNINYVFGTSDDRPQSWMSPPAYLAALIGGMPLVLFLPAHLVLSKLSHRSARLRLAGAPEGA